MKYGDLVRAPAGTKHCIEVDLQERTKLSTTIQSYATRTGAVLKFQSIDGFGPDHLPVYLLRVEVIKPGKPRQTRGRKPVEKG